MGRIALMVDLPGTLQGRAIRSVWTLHPPIAPSGKWLATSLGGGTFGLPPPPTVQMAREVIRVHAPEKIILGGDIF